MTHKPGSGNSPLPGGRPAGKISALLLLSAFIFLNFGCGTIDHIYTEHYSKFSFSRAQMIHDGVAILPMTTRNENAELAVSAQAIFLKSVRNFRKEIDFIEPERGEKILLDAGAYGALRELLATEFNKEVPQLQLIRQVGHALNKRFLLRPELSQSLQIEGMTQLKLRVQIWDVDLGEIVWEGTEESRGFVILVFPMSPAPMEKVMEVASNNLVKKMP